MEEYGFWSLFGVFFPAGTGIMVGASMSGKLRDPRRSIPRGILGAWAVALVAYGVTIVWHATTTPMDDLRADQFSAMRHALFGPGLLIGLVSSCASAALGSIAAAPNVLLALAQHQLVPAHRWLARTSREGTPRHAVIVAAILAAVALSLGDLDSIARVITVFFLLTYATVNGVVALEQALGMLSFRPSLKAPLAVPVVGALGTVFVLVQTEPTIGLGALAVVIIVYVVLARRRLEAHAAAAGDTVRSGLLTAIAHWTASATQRLDEPGLRAWKPDILVPLTDPDQLTGQIRLLAALAGTKGSVQAFVMVADDAEVGVAKAHMEQTTAELRARGLLATHVEVATTSMVSAVETAAAALRVTLMRPNILFFNLESRESGELEALRAVAKRTELGLAVLRRHESAGLGAERTARAWIRYQPGGLAMSVQESHIDLLLLLAYQLHRAWTGGVTLTMAATAEQIDAAREQLDRLREEARMPASMRAEVIEAPSLHEALERADPVDLHLMGLPASTDADALAEVARIAHRSVLFVADSGRESAFA